MQTRLFACFYVAERCLTVRLPAEIVADCRWASLGVWLSWLFVWLFEASFWVRQRDSWRSGGGAHAQGILAPVRKADENEAGLHRNMHPQIHQCADRQSWSSVH